MNYEKAYKEALERARMINNGEDVDVEAGSTTCEYIFPELKESKCENIRTVLIGYFNRYKEQEECGIKTFYGIPTDNILAWLENQGEKKPINDTDEEIVKAVKDTSILDMVKPKFNVGDWVVTSYGKVNRVIAVDKDGDGFTLDDDTYFSGSWKDSYHLWTIQDAKPGDVLVDDYGNVLIYQEPLTDCYYHSYCYCNEMMFIGQGGSHGIEHSHPATQRQRELLFQKMDEAHYEWDAEKKELKKIDNISNECKTVELDNEMAKATLIFVENCKDDFACNGVAKIDAINWFKEKFYGK